MLFVLSHPGASIPAPVFMRSISMWPEVRADGWTHLRLTGRLGLRFPLAPVFFAPLVPLFPFPYIPPPSPSSSPPELDFHNKFGLLFQFWQHWLLRCRNEGCRNSSAQDVCLCCPCHLRVAGILRRERTISWTAVGRGEWLPQSFPLGTQERTL